MGLFETLLILDGEPVELAAHLERLAASMRELFDSTPPPNLADAVAEHAKGIALGRMRIDVTPTGEDARLRAQPVDPADFFPADGRGAALRSVFADGGLGRHKWADRRPLAEVAGAPVPLLLDRDREVLEAGRANLFAVVDQVLVTPVADGRILPGTARAATIEIARTEGIEVRQRRLGREELLAADEVFLTGSVRGVEPARSLDGTELPGGGRLSRLLAARLRHRWHARRQDPAAALGP